MWVHWNDARLETALAGRVVVPACRRVVVGCCPVAGVHPFMSPWVAGRPEENHALPHESSAGSELIQRNTPMLPHPSSI